MRQKDDSDYDKHPQTGRLTLRDEPYDTSHDYLPTHLLVGPKARVMLLRNVDVACGLVNGAMGTITKVLPPKRGMFLPQGVMVLFDNERICQHGTSLKAKHQAIMITKFEENLPKHAVRFQFPLRLAWACTIHKVQGLTTDSAVVSLKNIFAAETWLEKKTVLPSIENFHFIHKDRFSSYHSKKDVFQQLKHKRHGGVGMYIGNDQDYFPRTLDLVNMECLVVYIKEINTNLVLVYRTETYPSSVFMDELHEVLISVPQENEDTSTLVMGGF
ncbi:unnamed protein product [Mytilus edulis]|nr:unnamed protein product [Mytilus edulis]